jgi:hypothetical protein
MAVRQRPIGPSPDQILATLIAANVAKNAPPSYTGSSSPNAKGAPRLGEPGHSDANDEIAKALFGLVASPILSISGINPLLAAAGKSGLGVPGTLDSIRTLLAAAGLGSSSKLTRAKAADASRKDNDPDLNGSVGDYQGNGTQAPTVVSGTAASNLVQSVFGGSSSSSTPSFFNGGSSGGSGYGGTPDITDSTNTYDTPTVTQA